jgi:hypothetical protein
MKFTTIDTLNSPSFHFIRYRTPEGNEGWEELENDWSVHRPQLVRMIASWEFPHIDKVFVAEPGLPLTDCTVDIARDVFLEATKDGEMIWQVRDWLHEVLGCDAVDQELAEEKMELL